MLKIKFIQYENLERGNFRRVLRDLQRDAIILIDAKLTPEEEKELIRQTMEQVSDRFKGIEMSSLDFSREKSQSLFADIRTRIGEMILGKKRGVTIIGPAHVLRKIKKNPEELLLYI